MLGSRSGASQRIRAEELAKTGGAPLPVFLASKRLKSFISKEIMDGPLLPVFYFDGTRKVAGYRADVLPAACDIWLRARDAGVLVPSQMDKAHKADMFMRALAHVGIVALVDEATGYQEVRDREALQAILDRYLRKELAAWAKRFPNEFYKEMFRLKGWGYNPLSVSRPGVVGKYTNDIVYDRLAPGIIAELEKLNPRNESGNRKNRHHQWLSDDIGHAALAQHIHATIGLMRASDNWENFMDLINRAFPKKEKPDESE